MAVFLPERDGVDLRPSAEAYQTVRDLTEALAAPLSPEDQTVQSMPDVSPVKWHRAHTTWFFETFLLGAHLPGYQVYDADYAFLFNSYYEALGARHPRAERGLVSRPGVEEISAYRRAVDAAMAELLARPPGGDVLGLAELGIHHEQQHQELVLMDIKHVLSMNPLRPSYLGLTPPPPSPDRPSGWLKHPGGLLEVGHDGGGFSFDNERPRHRVLLEPFALADRPVSCGDWLAFVDDGGYERPELWLSDGWAAVRTSERPAPLYWFADGDDWQVFSLLGPKPVDPAEPVCHISYYEADAYARWAGGRLPTEAEWEAVAGAGAVAGRFLDLSVLHPRPGPPGEAGSGLFGDVWEWTSSAYLPYPGFHPAAGAVGEYNGKFMVNQHVLRGGSCATPPGHIRPTYRNFFPPAARWAFSGARVARDA